MMRRGLPVESDLEKDPFSLYEGVEYQQFWTGRQKRSLDELEHAIVRNLLPVSGRRIIDVGCGFGRLADCYLDRFKQVVMLDGSMSLLRQAFEKTNGKAICIAGDISHMPFHSASFDAVLLIRVFHHINDSQSCLSELHRLLCNEGRFLFNYCNKQNAQRVLRWLMGANPENPFTAETASMGSTFISHHPKAVQRFLREAGFSSMQYYGAGVLDRLDGKLDLGWRGIALAKSLAPFLAWSKIAPWILCRAIAKGNTDLIEAREIDDLLQCPSCGSSLLNAKQEYRCVHCKKRYPVEAGIIDLRV